MHRAAVTEVRLNNWLKSGRGQEFGKDYRPFLQVTRQDHASNGHSHIVPNQFIGRQHHLLSALERKVCVLNLAQPVVQAVQCNSMLAPTLIYPKLPISASSPPPRQPKPAARIKRMLAPTAQPNCGFNCPHSGPSAAHS